MGINNYSPFPLTLSSKPSYIFSVPQFGIYIPHCEICIPHCGFCISQCGTEILLLHFTFNAKSFKKIDMIIPP